jgi:hypothetical protein
MVIGYSLVIGRAGEHSSLFADAFMFLVVSFSQYRFEKPLPSEYEERIPCN